LRPENIEEKGEDELGGYGIAGKRPGGRGHTSGRSVAKPRKGNPVL